MSIKWQPMVGPLFVDNISLTLEIQQIYKNEVENNFKYILPEFFGSILFESKLYKFNVNKYFGEGTIQIQCKNKVDNANFFRIQWNPSKVDSSDVADVVNLIIPGGYSELIHHGKITRIDITTDVINLNIDEFLFRYPGMKINYNYFKMGNIVTAYLGAENSDSQFKIYDKREEIKASNSKKPKLYKKPLPNHPTTRIEWRYRPKEYCTFANIEELCWPKYKKLECWKVEAVSSAPKTILERNVNAVIRLSRYEGFQQALYSLQKHERKDVLVYLRNNIANEWWSPESLWQTFPGSIESIVNPWPTKHIANQ